MGRSSRRRLDSRVIDEFMLNHQHDMTIEQVCRALCISHSTYVRHRRAIGMPPKTPHLKGITGAALDEYIANHIGDMSERDIAEVCGVSKTTVHRHIENMGLLEAHRAAFPKYGRRT